MNKEKNLVDVFVLPSGYVCLDSKEDTLSDCGIDIGMCQLVRMTIDEYNLIVKSRMKFNRKEEV